MCTTGLCYAATPMYTAVPCAMLLPPCALLTYAMLHPSHTVLASAVLLYAPTPYALLTSAMLLPGAKTRPGVVPESHYGHSPG
eukprot:847359-Rhodomonas_salina.1